HTAFLTRSLLSPLSVPTALSLPSSSLFLFTDTSTTEIYTLSLHDALPISSINSSIAICFALQPRISSNHLSLSRPPPCNLDFFRSEEHTSELQSRFDLVCRLLLEKKKKNLDRDLARTGLAQNAIVMFMMR